MGFTRHLIHCNIYVLVCLFEQVKSPKWLKSKYYWGDEQVISIVRSVSKSDIKLSSTDKKGIRVKW